MVRRRLSVHNFKRLLLWNRLANQTRILCGASLERGWPIGMKFYLKHHWGGGKGSLGFDPDRIRTLVFMVTDSSHRVTIGKTASSRFLECF